jgi:hypothetical protein
MIRQVTRRMSAWLWLSAYLLGIAPAGNTWAAETATYTYDVFGRLTNVQVSGGDGNGVQRSFAYDPSDNRTLVQVSGSSSSGSVTLSALGGVADATSIGVVIGVHIAGSGSLSGMVTFKENGVVLGSAFVNQGEASVILEGLSLGTHTIVASYSGDATNAPYSYTFTIKVQNLSWLPAVLQILLQ